MDDDDEPVGELLSRRRAIRLAGVPAMALLAGCSSSNGGTDTPARSPTPTDTVPPTDTPAPTDSPTPTTTPPGNTACVVRPNTAAGPFLSDAEDNPRRSDIRTDTETGERKEGVRFDLEFAVSELTDAACEPLEGAIVDVWHADALGTYSDVEDAGTGGQDFLRGHQPTDADGRTSFVTIYPGWYPGRTPHIHFRIRSPAEADAVYEFVSQLFFHEDRSDEVYDEYAPYAGRPPRDTENDDDPVYWSGDRKLTLDLVETDDGFEATFHVGLYVD